jgi:hypothetical protein
MKLFFPLGITCFYDGVGNEYLPDRDRAVFVSHPETIAEMIKAGFARVEGTIETAFAKAKGEVKFVLAKTGEIIAKHPISRLCEITAGVCLVRLDKKMYAVTNIDAANKTVSLRLVTWMQREVMNEAV